MASRPESAHYWKVAWHHDFPEEPVLLYSELDADRWELRKIEVYSDGRMDRADADSGTGTTFLSTEPLPPLDEIRVQAQFEPAVISVDEFEALWNAVGRAQRRSGD